MLPTLKERKKIKEEAMIKTQDEENEAKKEAYRKQQEEYEEKKKEIAAKIEYYTKQIPEPIKYAISRLETKAYIRLYDWKRNCKEPEDVKEKLIKFCNSFPGYSAKIVNRDTTYCCCYETDSWPTVTYEYLEVSWT